MLIIRHQKSPLAVRILKHRHQSIEIPGCRTFPDHNPLAAAKLLPGLPPLVVGNHSSCHIGIQLLSGKKRRMSVCQTPVLLRISQLV